MDQCRLWLTRKRVLYCEVRLTEANGKIERSADALQAIVACPFQIIRQINNSPGLGS
jgi:hypothetical protein